jgi:hypothetical protein
MIRDHVAAPLRSKADAHALRQRVLILAGDANVIGVKLVRAPNPLAQ